MATAERKDEDRSPSRPSPAPVDEATRPMISPRDPAAKLVLASLSAGAAGLRAAGPAALAGDPEGVHRMRTSANRLRGILRAFRPLIQAAWAEGVDAELHRLRDLLGAVRDLDVLRDRIRTEGADLLDALDPLFDPLEAQHAAARSRLIDALRGDRIDALAARLEEAAGSPILTEAADEPCRDAIPRMVAESWDRLRKKGRSLQPDDPDEAYHAVRRRAKRARYAAEAAAGALGPRGSKAAARFARRLRRVQDVLGRHQDAVEAREAVSRLAGLRPQDGPAQLASGRLIERLDRSAREARDAFAEAWDRLDRKGVRKWLRA